MSKELNKSICLKNIHSSAYKACPSLENSGRYIKAIHHLYNKLENEDEKLECQYLVNRHLSSHIICLQEAIINSFNTDNKSPFISKQQGDKFRELAKGEFSLKEGKYSLVDAEDLKTMQMLKRCVYLDKDLVLPCKVKSQDDTYHFNTEIIVTKNNVLSYASYGFEEDKTRNVNHNVLITKYGKGIKNSFSKGNEATR